MSLHQKLKNIKYYEEETLMVMKVLILLVTLSLTFLWGYFGAKLDKSNHPIIFISSEEVSKIGPIQGEESSKTMFGSRNGTKYYYIWCSGAGRIKEENKVWFKDREEAINKGYSKAQNCPGD